MASNFIENALGNWGAFAVRRRKSVLAGMLLLTAALGPFAYHALRHLDFNLANLVSGDLRRFAILREIGEDFAGDILAVALTIPENHTDSNVEDLKRFAAMFSRELAEIGKRPGDNQLLTPALNRELSGSPWLRNVECQSERGMKSALKTIAKQRPYVFVKADDIPKVRAMFEPEALRHAFDNVETTLRELPPNSLERERLRSDPLGIIDIVQSRIEKRKEGLAAGGDKDGFFLSKDRTMLVILARTALPASKLDFTRSLMTEVQRAENRVVEQFRKTNPGLTTALKGAVLTELAGGEKPGALEVGFTGLPAISVENENSLRFDMALNTALSLVLVLLLFFVGFRSLALTWDATWTMMIIINWTLAVAGILRGQVSVLGAAFTAIPIGLCTDYMILLYSTYYALRQQEHLPSEEAMRIALARSGPSILAGSLIAAIGFFGLSFTHLTGLSEFGLLGGAAALLGCFMMLVFYPAALARDNAGPVNLKEPRGMGLPLWGALLERRGVRIATLAVSMAIAAGSVLLIKFGPDPGPETVAGVKFDSELGNLRSLRIKAVPLRHKIEEKFGLAIADVRVLVEASNEADAFAANEEITRRMQPFVDRGELFAGGNINDYVPSPREQAEVIAKLRDFDSREAMMKFRDAAREKFLTRGASFFKPFLDYMNDFHLATREATPLTLAKVMEGPLVYLVAPFAKIEGGPAPVPDTPVVRVSLPAQTRVRLLSSWFPPRHELPPSWYDQLANTLERDPPPGTQVRMTAARMVGFELKDSTLRDCVGITLCVAIGVAISLALALRSLKSCLLAQIPVVFAFLGMLAGVPLSQLAGWDYSLNFINLLMVPLLLGSAVDCGVYMMFDYDSDRRPGVRELVGTTGRSVLYCMGTTLIAFGSFITSSYSGLLSMGISSLWGYTGATFGALVVLPAVLGMMSEAKSRRREGSGD